MFPKTHQLEQITPRGHASTCSRGVDIDSITAMAKQTLQNKKDRTKKGSKPRSKKQKVAEEAEEEDDNEDDVEKIVRMRKRKRRTKKNNTLLA